MCNLSRRIASSKRARFQKTETTKLTHKQNLNVCYDSEPEGEALARPPATVRMSSDIRKPLRATATFLSLMVKYCLPKEDQNLCYPWRASEATWQIPLFSNNSKEGLASGFYWEEILCARFLVGIPNFWLTVGAASFQPSLCRSMDVEGRQAGHLWPGRSFRRTPVHAPEVGPALGSCSKHAF